MIKALNILLDNGVLEIGVPIESGDSKWICFYVQENKTCPTVEFFETLLKRKNLEELKDSDDSRTTSEQIVAKFLDYLNRWIKKGKSPKVPDNYKPLTSVVWEGNKYKIYELKAYHGRLLVFYDGKFCIVTHGFIKKTKKTRKSDIERAKTIFKDYQRRKKELLKGEIK